MLFGVGVGVSCRILYSIVIHLYVSCSVSNASAGEERAIFILLSFTCNYVVSVQRGFLFHLVLGMGCVFYCGTHWAFNIITSDDYLTTAPSNPRINTKLCINQCLL